MRFFRIKIAGSRVVVRDSIQSGESLPCDIEFGNKKVISGMAPRAEGREELENKTGGTGARPRLAGRH